MSTNAPSRKRSFDLPPPPRRTKPCGPPPSTAYDFMEAPYSAPEVQPGIIHFNAGEPPQQKRKFKPLYFKTKPPVKDEDLYFENKPAVKDEELDEEVLHQLDVITQEMDEETDDEEL